MPVSRVPRQAAVVWVSHCWMGTPSRPDDHDGSKAKAIYEGLKVRRKDYSVKMQEGTFYHCLTLSLLPLYAF